MKLTTINHVFRKKDKWLYELSDSITDPKELLTILNLEKHPKYYQSKMNNIFPFRVPRDFVSRMKKNDPKDLLLLQVITRNQEFLESSEYITDPVKEKKFLVLPGLIHKYKDRVLLFVKTNCAIHCRYCFRKFFPYQINQGTKANWIESLRYIKKNKKINEVIFSGGDPLIAKDDELFWLITSLAKIHHIRRIRIHTRLLTVLPNRITSDLCEMFIKCSLKIIIVTHINHPQEINKNLSNSLLKLKKSGVILLNQSVLLKDINDNPLILAELSNVLCSHNIIPYYLHILDKVRGSMHFSVSYEKAKYIMNDLMKMISGYLVPRLVYDTGSKDNKFIVI